MKRAFLSLGVSAIAFCTTSAHATPIAIPNGDFENGGGLSNGLHNVLNDWTEFKDSGGSGAGVWIDHGPAHSPETDGAAYINDAFSGVHQNLSHNWSSSDIFQLGIIGFDASWRNGNVGDAFFIQLREIDGTVLWDSGPQLVDGTTSGNSYTGTGHIFNWNIDAGTFSGIAGAVEGSQINILIQSSDFYVPTTGASVPYVDDVTLSIVPEPSSLALLGLTGLCVLCRRRS